MTRKSRIKLYSEETTQRRRITAHSNEMTVWARSDAAPSHSPRLLITIIRPRHPRRSRRRESPGPILIGRLFLPESKCLSLPRRDQIHCRPKPRPRCPILRDRELRRANARYMASFLPRNSYHNKRQKCGLCGNADKIHDEDSAVHETFYWNNISQLISHDKSSVYLLSMFSTLLIIREHLNFMKEMYKSLRALMIKMICIF